MNDFEPCTHIGCRCSFRSPSYQGLFHQYGDGEPLPLRVSSSKLVDLACAILFPGYFGDPSIHSQAR